ncbi:ferritin family protein [Heliophilum fasciatum]|uniref:Rubrerythrin n=1 Tax=Heliophilum fasciatum TaxID=35700 RepID=A0A4R2RY63_9FIRM|nr:ferritin family protein [Heliophilum fasciatum]MCW2277016.1 rubrerythrin [Heliophilum fasciatum]TCP68458.1 rubrerythrin [Heliophilum fasciatum]
MRTKENILKALVYEQAAYYNYRKFAEEAKKEGLSETSVLFQALAGQEMDHKQQLLGQLKMIVSKELTRGRKPAGEGKRTLSPRSPGSVSPRSPERLPPD